MHMTEKPQQCGARTPNGPCELPPAPGSKRRCRLHSGGAPDGERNGQFKHGRFSRVMRAQQIAEINEHARAWVESQSKIDYARICSGLEQLRKKENENEKSA
jgi:hypothetical protein